MRIIRTSTGIKRTICDGHEDPTFQEFNLNSDVKQKIKKKTGNLVLLFQIFCDVDGRLELGTAFSTCAR